MKTCSKCKTNKDEVEFYKSQRTSDGLYERCKKCCKLGNAVNKPARKLYAQTLKGKAARRRYHQSESYKNVVQTAYHSSIKGKASLRKHSSLRKKKIAKATPAWVDLAAISNIFLNAVELEKSTGVKYNVDHIIPLAHADVCGLNVPWNLQILTEMENKIKGNSFDGSYDNNSWRVKYGISA